MKRLIAILCLTVTVLGVVGCSREVSDYSDTYNDEQSDMVEKPHIKEETDKAEYRINVDGVKVDINQYEGYKPYVLVFRTFRTKEDEISYNTHVFFMPVENDGSHWSLDDAKQKGLIHDYYYDASNSILVFYFKETEKCTLMPVSRDYKMKFGSLDTYWTMWNSACMKKIGLGGSYKMVEISPEQDFDGNEEVCAMKIICEYYSHAPMGSTTLEQFIFVDDIIDKDYPVSKIE